MRTTNTINIFAFFFIIAQFVFEQTTQSGNRNGNQTYAGYLCNKNNNNRTRAIEIDFNGYKKNTLFFVSNDYLKLKIVNWIYLKILVLNRFYVVHP